jgi:sterol desaturase/sphingolipid hydroxylase (fatty acid hydroxylase superfamily)
VDWLAGSRSHSLEIIINQTIEFAPIILLGANPVVVPIKALIDAVWGMFIHSNIDVKIGKAQYIINTPAMHQWHHADRYEVFYSNYSTKFSFWDFIFGTAYFPGFKPDVYGLPYQYPDDYFLQHAYSIKRFDYLKLYKNRFFNYYATSRIRCRQYLVNLFTFKKTSTRA